MTFIEQPLFTKLITELVVDDSYAEFQKELLQQPEKGEVIPHSGGLRKVRMSVGGRGKRGGARVIYLHLPLHNAIVFFYVYTKAVSENLTSEQLGRLRDAVEKIKKGYKP